MKKIYLYDSEGNATVLGVTTYFENVFLLPDETGEPNQGGNSSPGIGLDINDVGYDVVLLVGQSNCQGHSQSIDTNLDFGSPGLIYQFGSSGSYAGAISLAQEPLSHITEMAGLMGFPLHFAKHLLSITLKNRKILLVPAASGGTGFSDNNWNPGDALYNNAVSRANAAIALETNNRLIAIIWHQGEEDATAAMGKAAYSTALDGMIAGFRSEITGASDVPFIAGELVNDWVGVNADRVAIQEAIQELPTRVNNTFIVNTAGLPPQGDGIHFSADSMRTLGKRYFDTYLSYYQALNPQPPAAPYGLTLTVGGSGIIASWQQNGAVDSWDVRYKKDTDTSWTEINTTEKSRVLTNLNADTLYNVAVRSKNTAGNSSYVSAQATTSSIAIPGSILLVNYENGIVDASGNNVTLTPTNMGVTTDATRGQVLEANADSEQILVDLALPSSFTKISWVKLVGNPANPNIISSDANPNHTFWCPGTEKKVSGGLNGNLTIIQDDLVLVDSVWYFYALTYDSISQEMKLYRNGNLVKTVSSAGSYTGSPSPIRIGAYQANDNNWSGSLDEQRIYSTVLTPDQIREIYIATYK